MPSEIGQILIDKFDAGWCPSDDPINGRKNALLQMDNVELDANGALRLTGGTAVKWSGFPANAHTLYSRVINGARHEYSGLANGSVYRDTTSIVGAGSGDSSNTAFGSAFNFVLACSGNSRIKDNGAAAVNLGITAPTVAPVFISAQFFYGGDAPSAVLGTFVASTVTPTGTSAVINSPTYASGHLRVAGIQYLQITADVNGQAIVQNTGIGAFDATSMADGFGGPNGAPTDDDLIPFYGYTTNPWGASLQIDIMLSPPNAFGDPVSNTYTYKIDDISTLNFDPGTGVFYTYLKRSDFIRVGSSDQTWSTVYGVRLTFQGTSGQVINILGNTINPLAGYGFFMFGGTTAMNGVYEFAQVNVNNTGSYQALSPLGPSTGPIPILTSQVYLRAQVPGDAQVNEVWIFARSTGGVNSVGKSGSLDKWYRVAKLTSAFGTNFHTQVSDQTTLTLNIFYNQKLVSINSSSITDKIYSIVGPINGRWYYFTTNMMYPSDINNPDLVDTSLGVRTTGSNSEIFLWAFEVAEGVVLIGTSVNVYVLSGTFQTLADFTIDIYYRGLGCKYPPITYDAAIDNGTVVYLASDGWRTIAPNGENRILTAPNTDILYRGESRYNYSGPNLKIVPGSVRFPVCIGKNKLWCFITGTNRCEVYDFIRRYWRPVNYNLGDVTACASTQDGQIIGFYTADARIREIDISTSRLIDGTTKQIISVLFPVTDGGLPKQRKDSCTIKLRTLSSAGNALSLYVSSESVLNRLVTANVVAGSGGKVTEVDYDLSQLSTIALVKTYQVLLTGGVGDFLLDDIEINYTLRPPQVSFLRLLNNNYGTASPKRMRVWPHVIDTLGHLVVFTPYADNIGQPSTIFTSSNKDTKRAYFKTDVNAVDYGATLYCADGLFEYFGELTPEIVQHYPVAKQFDQLGPEEFFRFGKIQKLRLRILPVGGISIPYTIYFQDSTKYTNTFNVNPYVDATYEVNMPKGVSGNIIRIELGPTSFDFYRFYAQVLVAESGRDTDNQWINLQ